MGKVKIVGKIIKTTGKIFAPTVTEQATKFVRKQIDKRDGYVKIPDVLSMPLDEAIKVLESYGFQTGKMQVEAHPKYATKKAEVVLRVAPRVGTSVAPGTFLKLEYADEATILNSKELLEEKNRVKANKKQKQQETVKNVGEKSKKIVTSIGEKAHIIKQNNK